jgi:hypothetical protein
MGKRKGHSASGATSKQRRQQGDVTGLKTDRIKNNDITNGSGLSSTDNYSVNKANIKSIILAHKTDKQNKLQRIKWINRLLVMSIFSVIWIVGVKLSGGGGMMSGQMIGTSVVAQHKDFPLLSSSFLQEQEHGDLNDDNDYGRLNKINLDENEDKSKSLVQFNKKRLGGKLLNIGQNLLHNLLINPTLMLRRKLHNLFIRLARK